MSRQISSRDLLKYLRDSDAVSFQGISEESVQILRDLARLEDRDWEGLRIIVMQLVFAMARHDGPIHVDVERDFGGNMTGFTIQRNRGH